jgi:hypothetical protein
MYASGVGQVKYLNTKELSIHTKTRRISENGVPPGGCPRSDRLRLTLWPIAPNAPTCRRFTKPTDKYCALLARLLLALVFFCAIAGPSVAQQAPITESPDRSTYDALWVAHASFQAHRRDDYVTPLLLRAMVREIRKNPNASYPELMAQAVDLHKQFVENNQYANTGRLSDPFEQEKRIAEWAKDIAPYSKNPLAPLLAEVLNDSFKLGSALTLQITGLDEQQQVEYRSFLYRSAMDMVDQTFRDVQEEGQRNPKARDALNNFLVSNLDVKLGESVEEIRRKSPEVVAILQNDEILQLLKKGGSDPKIQALIEKQLQSMRDQTDASYELVKQAYDMQLDLAARQAMQAKIENEQRTQKVRIEAARAGLSLLLKIMGPEASDDQKRAVLLGDASIRAWEAVVNYQETMRTVEDAGGAAGAALTFNLFAIMIDVVNMINQTPSESEQATTEILKGLNELKHMVSDLYAMTSRRFDRLELILESYQQMNAQMFQILIVQGQITAQDLDTVRSSLSETREDIRISRAESKQIAKSSDDTRFRELQRKCYLERITIRSTKLLTEDEFESCLQGFASFAFDVSSSQSFLGTDATPGDLVSDLSDNPYEEEHYLIANARKLGSTGARQEPRIHNANIWADATLAYMSTIEAWPKLADSTDFARLRQIVAVGNQLESAWDSILVVPCQGKGPNCMAVNDKLFHRLLEQYSADIVHLGVEANNTATRYAKQNSDLINPFAFGITPMKEITPDDDPRFAIHLSSHAPKCDNDPNLPDSIPMPPGMIKFVPPEMRLAERLDPAEHSVDFCYELDFRDRRHALLRYRDSDHNEHYYYGAPWLTFRMHMKNSKQTITVAENLPDMIIGWSHEPIAALSDSKDLGLGTITSPSDNPRLALPTYTSKYGTYDKGFPQWLSDGGLTTFSKNAVRANRVEITDFLEKPGVRVVSSEAIEFVHSELENRRRAAAAEIEMEFSREGDQRKALRQLSSTKKLLELYLEAVLPISSHDSAQLEEARFAYLEVYNGDLEWQTLLTTNRPAESKAWFRTRWYPGGFGPPAATPQDRLMYGVEDLVVLGITGEIQMLSVSGGGSVIEDNVHKLLAGIVGGGLYRGGKLPERAPLFSATLGIANTLLSAHEGVKTRKATKPQHSSPHQTF